ncbi:hypothetical protein J5N97_015726 [Dioscorea zingiberensis]|uniref:Uncharacterized protein n=1 Tax=Dioscorea zingiberensis TaxID=325984 RepID=A0A9D5CI38_9LILI|nr:hypothetical protein J5N97_015726 [Dioscorea zingiberensis]
MSMAPGKRQSNRRSGVTEENNIENRGVGRSNARQTTEKPRNERRTPLRRENNSSSITTVKWMPDGSSQTVTEGGFRRVQLSASQEGYSQASTQERSEMLHQVDVQELKDGIFGDLIAGVVWYYVGGMGTKVHRESYLPGYYTMRDPNEGASSGWFQYYDRTSSEHLYDGLFPKPVNGHLNHDMEIVKRTMLEHDAVFKKQVYELHRLYRVQKELMKELKMIELTKGSVPMDASRSNSSLSQMPSEVTKHVSQMYHLPGLSNSYKGMSTTDNDDLKIPLNFLENGSRTSPSSSVQKVNGVLVKDGESSGSKISRYPKRMIDLELPADAYIDCEDTEGVEMENIGSSMRVVTPLNKGSDLTPENDVKLTLSVGKDTSSMGICLKPYSQNAMFTQRLSYVNECIKGTCAKEVPNPASSNFFDTKSYIEEIQEHQDPTRSCKNFLGQDRGFFKDKHGNEGTNLNFFHANEEVRRELPLFNSEAGQSRSTGSSFSPSLCSERSLVSPLKPKKLCGNNSPDQSRREKWFGEELTYFPENSERGPYFANSSYSRSTSQTVHPFSVPQAEYSIPPSPLVSTSRKSLNGITHIPIAVQALPCFTGSSAVGTHHRSSKSRIQNGNLSDTQDRWRNGDLKSHSTSEGQPSLYSNGFHHGSQSDSPASHLFPTSFNLGKPNLKLGEDLAYGNSEFHGPRKMCNSLQLTDVKSVNAKDKVIQNGIQTQQDKAISDIEWRHAESSSVISWLGAKSPSMRSVDRKHVEYYPYASSSRSTAVPRFEWGQEKERTGISNFLDPASALAVKERRFQINEVSDGPSSKRILGFSLADQIQENMLNPVPNSHEKLSLSAKSKHKQIDGCTKERNSKRRTYMSELFSGTGAGNTSKVPSENSIAIPSPLSFQSFSAKATPVIDLEASNNLQEEDSAPSRHLGKLVQNPYSKANGSLEEDLFNDLLIRVAAENIIVLSSDTCGYVKDTTLCELPPVSFHSLHWFAEVVSSIEKNVGNVGHEDDGLDSFESITLKLEEIKVEEYIQWSKPRELDNSNDGETNAASLLFTKPRRGQARRRRQKDFQKDILPGLVSLSRHEVTEDLQTIGAMMRAAGMPWPLGLSRRGTGQGRGRRRTKNTAITVEENPVSPPLKQPSSTEAEVNGAGMVGWGRRTTRQCRRQRYQSGNVALLLT